MFIDLQSTAYSLSHLIGICRGLVKLITLGCQAKIAG